MPHQPDVIIINPKGVINEVHADLAKELLKKPGYKLAKMRREEVPGYAPRRRVKWTVPMEINYRYDGYGRLAQFVMDSFEIDAIQIKGALSMGTLRRIEKPGGNFKHALLTMFESNRIPDKWVDLCNECFDLLIVPSQFCVDVFTGCGVKTPIVKLPLFATRYEPYAPQPQPFVFAHQNAMVEGAQKGWDLVIRAFLTLFKGNPNVKLLLKARKHEWANDRWYYEELRKHPNIELVIDDYAYNDMHEKFFSRVNCFVYPSRGEGWGLPPLEAMAHGIPTILTDAHSHTEFSKFGIRVGTTGHSYSFYAGRVSDAGTGYWVEPDFDQLVEKMKWVYENYQKAKAKAVKNVDEIKKLYGPEQFLDGLQSIMDGLCE